MRLNDNGSQKNERIDLSQTILQSANILKTIETEYNQVIYFDGSESSDADGQITNYEWLIDGEMLSPLIGAIFDNKPDKASWRATTLGDHHLDLVVTDGQGGQTKETITITVKEDSTKKGFTLLFVPLDWSGSMESFDSIVELNKKMVTTQFHLDECPEERIHALKIRENCAAGLKDNWVAKNDVSWMLKLYSCIENSGNTEYDYIIALKEKYGGEPARQITDTDIILVDAEEVSFMTITLTHEIAHIFGLHDEYYDDCRCFDAWPNCLDASIGGGDSVDPSTEGYCAGGSQCPNQMVPTCWGNLNVYGGRCIMGASNAWRPREFCPHCREYLSKKQELKC
jgi:hypothetical protein